MVANTVGDSAQFNQGVLVQLDKLIAQTLDNSDI